MLKIIIEWLTEYISNINGLGVFLGVLLENFITHIMYQLIPTTDGFILIQ